MHACKCSGWLCVSVDHHWWRLVGWRLPCVPIYTYIHYIYTHRVNNVGHAHGCCCVTCYLYQALVFHLLMLIFILCCWFNFVVRFCARRKCSRKLQLRALLQKMRIPQNGCCSVHASFSITNVCTVHLYYHFVGTWSEEKYAVYIRSFYHINTFLYNSFRAEFDGDISILLWYRKFVSQWGS